MAHQRKGQYKDVNSIFQKEEGKEDNQYESEESKGVLRKDSEIEKKITNQNE
jgi:hypothetical protein